MTLPLSRRELFAVVGLHALASGSRLTGAADPAKPDVLPPLNRFPLMVQEFYRPAGPRRGAEGRPGPRRAQDPRRRRRLRRRRAEEDRRLLRPVPRADAAQPEGDRHRRPRCLHHREGDLREPAQLPGHRQPVPAQREEAAGARGRRVVRPLDRREGRAGVPVVLPGARADGLRGADLRPDRAGGAAAVRPPARQGRSGYRRRRAQRHRQPAAPRRRVLRQLAGVGRDAGRSTTCSPARRSIRSRSASPATPAAAR